MMENDVVPGWLMSFKMDASLQYTLPGRKSDSLYENFLCIINVNVFGCTYQIFIVRQFRPNY